MIDYGQSFVTAGITTGLGTVGYLGVKLFAEPIIAQRRLRAKIAYALTYYANAYHVPWMAPEEARTKLGEAQDALRKLASDLRESRHAIPLYRLLECLGLVIDRRSLQKASAELIGWSNSLYNGDRSERLYRIAAYLSIGYDADVTEGTRDQRHLSSTVEENKVAA